jgi:hypothetical protein
MKTMYGYDVKSIDDPFVTGADKSVTLGLDFLVPNASLINTFPVLGFIQYFTMPPHSTWNPCGTDLFHVESMDSTWIPHGICFTT